MAVASPAAVADAGDTLSRMRNIKIVKITAFFREKILPFGKNTVSLRPHLFINRAKENH